MKSSRQILRKSQVVLLVLLSLSFARTSHAVPFSFEARSLAMGGVSTATADLATAAWANPAMLTNQDVEDDFSLLIGLGAFARDDDDLLGDIDDFQDADERREEAIDAEDLQGAAEAIVDMYSILNEIDSKIIAPEATALFAIGTSFESFSMAISARQDVIAGGVVTDLACDVREPGCDPRELISEDKNILNVDGVIATELGIAFAMDFQLWNRKVSVGIKPKIVELDVFSVSESILTVDTDEDYARDRKSRKELDTFETIDLGLAMDLSDSVRLGLNVRNLITDEFEIFEHTLNLDTEVRAGIAYHNDFLTLAADIDLIENEPLLANDAFEGLRTQYVAIGSEFNLRYLKLRLGARKNVASDISSGAEDPTYTAGVGIWLGFNLDIAAIVNEHTAGAIVQTGFQF